MKRTTTIGTLLLFATISIFTAPLALATPPTIGAGSFDSSIPETTTQTQLAGNNVIVHVQGGGGHLFGTFVGTWIHDEQDIVNLATGQVIVQGVWDSSDLTVNGVPGTAHVGYTGIADAATGEFQGQWLILSCTGGLANLRGQGTVSVDEFGVGAYTIQYHFD